MPLLDVVALARPPFFPPRDLQLDAGEIVVMRGPSGSGKSLFLRAIADLDPAEATRVGLDGVSRDDMPAPAWRRRVRYVHQAGVRLPGTVAANLERVASLENGRASAGRLSVPDLSDDRDVQVLSGGEAQALAIERALLGAPRVLLLDESTSAMDPARAERWESRIRAWVDEGHAAVWVAHDDRLVARIRGRLETFP